MVNNLLNKEDGRVTTIYPLPAYINAGLLIYVFALYDSLTETACKKFPPAVFVSDWLELLIHIHSVHRIFAHFLLFVDE